jgi:Na+/H+ antiporter NhaD/arsenite permease-like protein
MNQSQFLIVSCIIALATFVLSVLQSKKRTVIFLIGAMLIGAIGVTSGRYCGPQILVAINLPVLLLILALVMFSELLNITGVLEWLSLKIERKYVNPAPVIVLLLIIIYAFSMAVNNLAAVLVLLPLIFRLGSIFRFDMKRFLTAFVIASNLGGASTIIGDFPNIIISQYAKATPVDFFVFLGLPILPLAVISFFLFYKPYLKKLAIEAQRPENVAEIRLLKRVAEAPEMPVKWGKVLLFLLCFISMLVVMNIFTKVNTAFIGIGFAVLLLMFLREDDKLIFKLDLSSLVFFGALFVIVGGLTASRLFNLVGEFLLKHIHNPFFVALALMYFASIVTALFSAGPSTASLIPIAVSLGKVVPGNIIWWSLSLGVLAGSSATLIGATAGPVMANLYERETKDTFTLADFSRLGVPTMLIYLLLSSFYIFILCQLS